MRVILNELKKIFTMKMMLVLAAICSLFYYMFISFDINYFPNGRPASDEYHIAKQMINEYGHSLDKEEYQSFKKKYDQEVRQTDQYLQSNKTAQKLGISTYQQFKKADNADRDFNKFYNQVIFEKPVDYFWELQARDSLIENYEAKGHILDQYTAHQELTESQQARIDKAADSASIFPYMVFENYNNLIRSTAMLILLSIMFMLTPVFLKDRRNKMQHLQYTTKTGRPLFKKKIAAALIAAFLITTVEFLLFFILYSTNDTAMFFDSNINSVFFREVFWFDFTFFDYIMLTVVLVYLLSFGTAMAVAFISSLLPNYLSLIGLQVPLAFILFHYLFRYLIEYLTVITLPVYFLTLVYGVLLAGTVLLAGVRWRRERRADVYI